jgi:hypothetical protein
MNDKELLLELLAAEDEEAALAALSKRGLLSNESRWRAVGGVANNEAVILNQQSNAAASLGCRAPVRRAS